MYGPDRWLIILGTLTIDSDNGCLFVSSGCVFDQGFENLQIGVYTFSAFCVDGSVHSVTFNVTGSETDYYHLGCGLWVKASANGIRLYNSTSDSLGIKAAKLELGSQQTLAHIENGAWQLNEIPDYGEQLARCQRYFQLYSASDKRPAKAVDCRPVMRADPSQGTIVIGSTTYYYNTADL